MPDIYEMVTSKIIVALSKGSTPWLKPWNGKSTGGILPFNAVSGRPYNGINLLILGTSDYSSLGWLTYKQAASIGGNVKRGEKGTTIVFWQFNKGKDKDTGEVKVIPFAKAYTVFNVEQCEGLDASKIIVPPPAVAGASWANDVAAKHGAKVAHGGDRAFFNVTNDYIRIPSAADFKTPEAYQATLAHELTHWTGHEKRLSRQFGKRFGDNAYAFEELVAEIGSAFLCAAHGVALETLQHPAYIAAWLDVLRTDNRAIFTAASKAKAAAEYLTGKPAEVSEDESAAA
jgi:antirestriction protein ArdC